jgi:hypothetical protein
MALPITSGYLAPVNAGMLDICAGSVCNFVNMASSTQPTVRHSLHVVQEKPHHLWNTTDTTVNFRRRPVVAFSITLLLNRSWPLQPRRSHAEHCSTSNHARYFKLVAPLEPSRKQRLKRTASVGTSTMQKEGRAANDSRHRSGSPSAAAQQLP